VHLRMEWRSSVLVSEMLKGWDTVTESDEECRSGIKELVKFFVAMGSSE